MQIGQMEVLQEEDWSRMVGWPPLHTFSCSTPPLWFSWFCELGGCAWAPVTAKEREIIVNPIHCLMHPFDKIGEEWIVGRWGSLVFLFFLSRPSAQISWGASPERPPSLSPLPSNLTGSSFRSTSLHLPAAFDNNTSRSPPPPRFWTGDLEMKADFTLFCRTWIGILYASGEDTFSKFGARNFSSIRGWSRFLFFIFYECTFPH